MDFRQNARVVVLVELADGTLRAIDGTGNVEIDMRRKDDFEFNMFYNPRFIHPLKTRLTVDIVGTWTMYQSNYPDQPGNAPQIEDVRQIENMPKRIAEPGDHDYEW